jgi:hypothetical protein
MRKTIIGFITIFFLFTHFFGNAQNSLCQEKQEVKKKKEQAKEKESKTKGIVGGVTGGVLGGVVGGVLSKSIDTDFLVEPKKIIELKIEHLEIRPSATIPLKGVIKLKTESGSSIKYEISSPSLSLKNLELQLKPVIVDPKGIMMNIQISQAAKILHQQSVLTGNLQPVIVELLKNKDKSIKLADKITPIIQVIMPPLAYPHPLHEIKMVRHILFMNEEFISRGGTATASAESDDSLIFLYFWIKDKGLFLLSFKAFDEAEPIGVVKNNIIKIKHGEDYFEWISMEPILPVGEWSATQRKYRVWVRHNPDYDPKSILSEKESNYTSGIASGNIKTILQRFLK